MAGRHRATARHQAPVASTYEHWRIKTRARRAAICAAAAGAWLLRGIAATAVRRVPRGGSKPARASKSAGVRNASASILRTARSA